jgi:hypothetical protein
VTAALEGADVTEELRHRALHRRVGHTAVGAEHDLAGVALLVVALGEEVEAGAALRVRQAELGVEVRSGDALGGTETEEDHHPAEQDEPTSTVTKQGETAEHAELLDLGGEDQIDSTVITSRAAVNSR